MSAILPRLGKVALYQLSYARGFRSGREGNAASEVAPSDREWARGRTPREHSVAARGSCISPVPSTSPHPAGPRRAPFGRHADLAGQASPGAPPLAAEAPESVRGGLAARGRRCKCLKIRGLRRKPARRHRPGRVGRRPCPAARRLRGRAGSCSPGRPAPRAPTWAPTRSAPPGRSRHGPGPACTRPRAPPGRPRSQCPGRWPPR